MWKKTYYLQLYTILLKTNCSKMFHKNIYINIELFTKYIQFLTNLSLDRVPAGLHPALGNLTVSHRVMGPLPPV